MIITDLKGGLGNQMFQYAAGLALSLEKSTVHKVDLTHFDNQDSFANETPRPFLLDRLNTHYEIASQEDLHLVKSPIPVISNVMNILNAFLVGRGYLKYPLHIGEDMYLDGYFQKQEYFEKYTPQIISEFQLKEEYETKNFLKIAGDISNDEYSVSVHIRRGDYITNPGANKHHGVLNNSYYKDAYKFLSDRLGEIRLYVFSDDIDWVKENMPFLTDYKVTYVSSPELIGAQEMSLMSKCKHNIIANSSFSWWGAWLNQNEAKTVVAPKSWLRDGDGINKGIVPEDWIRI